MIHKNWILLLFLFIIALLVAADVYFWQKTAEIQKLHAASQQQRKAIENLQNQITQLTTLQNAHKTEDLIDEISYLIDLANLYLQTEHNIPNAIKTLSLAKQHLQSVNDPHLLALEQAITSDLAMLAEIPVVDKSNILMQLQRIGENINKLNPNSNKHVHPKKHWWEKISNNFKNLIVIQYSPVDTAKLYSPDILYNLHQAQWAVLQAQQDIYQQSIDNIKNALSENYVPNPAQDKIIAALNDLSQQSIAPRIPSLTRTNQALAQVRNEQT